MFSASALQFKQRYTLYLTLNCGGNVKQKFISYNIEVAVKTEGYTKLYRSGSVNRKIHSKPYSSES